MKKTRQDKEYQPSLYGSKVVSAFYLTYPTVAPFIDNASRDLVSLRITFRGEGDYLAVAKRYGSDGGLEVLFGSGHTWYGCLGGLETAMEQSKWRQDKWNKGGKPGKS